MKKKEKVQKIQTILQDLYPDPAAPLNHSDPYTLLVAVMLSAQTTDKKGQRGNPAPFFFGGYTQKNVQAFGRNHSRGDKANRTIQYQSEKSQKAQPDYRPKTQWHCSTKLRRSRGPSGCGAQDGQRCNVPSIWGASLSCRYTYSQTRISLGAIQWKKCCSDRKRSKETLPQKALE